MKVRLEKLEPLQHLYVADMKVRDDRPEIILLIKDSGFVEIPDEYGGTYTMQQMGEFPLQLSKEGCTNLSAAIAKKDTTCTVFNLDDGTYAEQAAKSLKGVFFIVNGKLVIVPPENIGKRQLSVETIARRVGWKHA